MKTIDVFKERELVSTFTVDATDLQEEVGLIQLRMNGYQETFGDINFKIRPEVDHEAIKIPNIFSSLSLMFFKGVFG